jgi:hypothetical protein
MRVYLYLGDDKTLASKYSKDTKKGLTYIWIEKTCCMEDNADSECLSLVVESCVVCIRVKIYVATFSSQCKSRSTHPFSLTMVSSGQCKHTMPMERGFDRQMSAYHWYHRFERM